MNIKSILTALSVVTATSTSIAMADVRVSGSIHASGGVTIGSQEPTFNNPNFNQPYVVRDHRIEPTWAPSQPIVRDHRRPRPVIVHPVQPAPQPQYSIVCNENSYTTLSSSHLYGTKDNIGSVTFDMRTIGRLDELSFSWNYGTTVVKTVLVTYANGTTKLYNIGDALTQNPNNRMTRTIDLDNRGVVSITVTGYSKEREASFSVLGKA